MLRVAVLLLSSSWALKLIGLLRVSKFCISKYFSKLLSTIQLSRSLTIIKIYFTNVIEFSNKCKFVFKKWHEIKFSPIN